MDQVFVSIEGIRRYLRLAAALSLLAALLVGFQNCAKFEAAGTSSQNEGQSTGPINEEMTEAQAIALGQGQHELTSSATRPSYCARYPQYVRFWPQCQVIVDPIDSVVAGNYYGMTLMRFEINSTVTSLSNIEVQLEYTLSNDVKGTTGWVSAANGVGSDWSTPYSYTPNGVDHQITARYTVVPQKSYLDAVKFIRFSVRTKDSRYLHSAEYNLPNPTQI